MGYEIAVKSLESRILGHEKKLNWLGEESSKNLDELLNSQMSARDKTGLGYGTQLNELMNNSKTIRNFLTPRADISFAGLDEYAIRKKIIESKTTDLNTKTSETVGKTNEANTQKPKTVYESVNKDKVIIEDWNSDDEDDVSEVQTSQEPKLKTVINTGPRVDKPVWDNAKRVNHQKFSNKLKYPHLRKEGSQTSMGLWQKGLVNTDRSNVSTARSISTVRPVYTVRPVSTARPLASKIAQSNSVIRPNHPRLDIVRPKASNSPIKRSYFTQPVYRPKDLKPDVKTFGVKNMTTVGTRAVVSKGKVENVLKKAKWGNPEILLQDHAVVDSGCSSHMTGNKAYLSDYEDFNGGFVAFGSDPKGDELKFNLFSVSQMCDKKNSVLFTESECLILSPSFKLLDESQVVLRAPRKDDVTEFKNYAMNEFYAKKEIKREFSVARTPQQNEAVNTACYVLNRVLVTKPQNKTPYELLIGKFDGKSDEGYLLGYSTSSKAFRVYNKRTKRVEENLHINFLEDQPNVTGTGSSGKDKGLSHEYILLPLQPHRTRIPVKDVVQDAQEKPSENASSDKDVQDSEDAADKEEQHQMQENEKDLQDELEMMVTQELAAKAMDDVSRQAFEEEKRRIASQKKAAQATSTNQLSTDRPSVSTDRPFVSTDRLFVSIDRSNTPNVSAASTSTGANADESSFFYLGGKIPIDASTLPNVDLPIDQNMHFLEYAFDTFPNDGIFNGTYDDDEDVGAEADFNNMDNTIAVSPIPTHRIHKDHPKGQILGDPTSAVQTRGKIQKASSAQQALVEAMQEELLQFKLQKVWVLVDLPYGKKVIGTKWVFRNKEDERSIVFKNKAWLVAQGFRQEEGMDYDEVFAPIARIEVIRLFLAFASYMGFTVYQMDVKSAFLYGTIEEEVYVHQPPGFVDPAHPNKVYKVIKALYGLHQAPRAWYETLSSFLMENGFRRGTIDKTLFIKKKKSDIMLVQVYVDDIIFGSTKQSMCTEFEDCMHKRFQMSSMGELTFFLGLQVKQLPEGIFISQDKYVADILKKFDFLSIRTATTPIESNKPLVKDEDGVDVDVHVYRSMIGSLMYLTASRPDIMFAVCACARFQVTPKVSHLNAVKMIFRYLKHQPKLGLWYPRDSPFELEAFSDSDYRGASLDRKSTTGGCQFLGRRLISWQCKKQTIMANSTTEAKYVAAANCCRQVLWIQNQMMDYGFNFMNTKIHIDNESTISVIKNPVAHSRTKHIEIRFYFIRDCYDKRLIEVIKIHTNHNVADLLTKGFDVTRISMDLRMDRSCAANSSYTWYALTHNPTIYDSLVKQFWQTATVRTLANVTQQLIASIDSTKYPITEAFVRSKLQLADATGIHNLSDAKIYAGLATLGPKSGGWDQFGSTIATALICLSSNRVYNFSKMIFDGMVHNIERDFVPLLPAMLADAAMEPGEGSAQPTEPHHTRKDIKVKKSKKPTRNEETSTRERFEANIESRIKTVVEKSQESPVWGCDRLVSRAKVIENQVSIAPEVGAAAVALPAEVLELDTHSSSEADPSEKSDTEMPERHVSPTPHDAMLTRWRSRVASRSSSPTTSTLKIPTALILPPPSAIVAPSTDITLLVEVHPRFIDDELLLSDPGRTFSSVNFTVLILVCHVGH
ncbi:putative ribonuclease H-like domain-containing protein [Tanacetum coccineum]